MAEAAQRGIGAPVQDRFNTALAALVEQVKRDRSILAAILCGSLSHDTVWSKSDIDLVLVTIDDKKPDCKGVFLYADGINVHANLMTRGDFRKTVEGSLANSFIHSLLAKGRLLYTHDETIAALCQRLTALGERDTRLQLLAAASHALPCLYKAQKWLITRGDLDYAALWILYAANALARIEVLQAGLLADREVLPQALKLNPSVFKIVLVSPPDLRRPSLYVDGQPVPWEDLETVVVRELKLRPPSRPVYLDGDPNMEWEWAGRTIDRIRGLQAEVVLLARPLASSQS